MINKHCVRFVLILSVLLSSFGSVFAQTLEEAINKGMEYANQGEYDRAIPEFNKAIEINPNSAKAYTNRGAAYDAKGDHDQAILVLLRPLKLIPVTFMLTITVD